MQGGRLRRTELRKRLACGAEAGALAKKRDEPRCARLGGIGEYLLAGGGDRLAACRGKTSLAEQTPLRRDHWTRRCQPQQIHVRPLDDAAEVAGRLHGQRSAEAGGRGGLFGSNRGERTPAAADGLPHQRLLSPLGPRDQPFARWHVTAVYVRSYRKRRRMPAIIRTWTDDRRRGPGRRGGKSEHRRTR